MDPLQRLSQRLRAVVEELPLRTGMRVLEVGGAPGAAARAVATIVGDAGFVLVLDRSEAGITRTQEACADEIARGVMDVRLGDVECLKLADGEPLFDLVFACRVGVLDGRHPRQYESALSALRAATVPGAELFLDTGDPVAAVPLHPDASSRSSA